MRFGAVPTSDIRERTYPVEKEIGIHRALVSYFYIIFWGGLCATLTKSFDETPSLPCARDVPPTGKEELCSVDVHQ